MRHLWAECPQYEGPRLRIGRARGIPAAWWARQPKMTAKSGWVTVDCGTTLDGRARRQVAAAELALMIFRDFCPSGEPDGFVVAGRHLAHPPAGWA